MKNKKGFTLVELLAVLAILATILLIAIPSITSSLNRSEEQDLENRKQIILSEAELKIDDIEACLANNDETTLKNNGEISISKLVECGIITDTQSKDKKGNLIKNNTIEFCIMYNDNNELVIENCKLR